MTDVLQPITVDALDVIDNLTIEVRLKNGWRLRLGLWVLALAARILRCGVQVNEVMANEVTPSR